ncbi:hypothetical protein P872_02825 [Rhodonellum psychrophilum GCM71 = DSM 17998]|uniref:Uncharacterized protein n=1 Tax=Rhodonellum psychrophilum GCM71 = DSM 17998 TaxID=1123057 RepID=U5C6B8_9BACT|nr:hypothetical protein P872_02825 [Rhodonellum psychrophilum GCM71 = DSM 17998]
MTYKNFYGVKFENGSQFCFELPPNNEEAS